MQLSREATVSVRIRSTDSAKVFKKLGDEIGRSALSLNTDVAAGRFIEVTARRTDLVLRLHDYNV